MSQRTAAALVGLLTSAAPCAFMARHAMLLWYSTAIPPDLFVWWRCAQV